MRRKIYLFCLAVFLAISFNSRAQAPSLNPFSGVVPTILNSAGGTYDNATSYYRYEWSLGELLLIQSFATADSSILVTQGVLQPCTDHIGISPYTVLFEEIGRAHV